MLQTSARVVLSVSQKNSRSHFLRLVYFRCIVLRLNDTLHTTAKEYLNGQIGRNTLVQLLALHTDPDSHKTQRYRQTDKRTDGRDDDANSRSYCVAVRSAKNDHPAVSL